VLQSQREHLLQLEKTIANGLSRSTDIDLHRQQRARSPGEALLEQAPTAHAHQRLRTPAQCPPFRCRQSAASRADAEGTGLGTARPHIDHQTNAARTGPRTRLRDIAVGSASFLPAASRSPFVREVDAGAPLSGRSPHVHGETRSAPAEGMTIGCPKNSTDLAERSSDARRPSTATKATKPLRHARRIEPVPTFLRAAIWRQKRLESRPKAPSGGGFCMVCRGCSRYNALS